MFIVSKVLCTRAKGFGIAIANMSEIRINGYHVMWVFVFFDLPVMTKLQRKRAAKFRLLLEKDGFVMMQYSVYIRHCPSHENMDVHIKRVRSFVPDEGQVSILTVTGKQYGNIINYNGKVLKKCNDTPQQLELF
jgi:CRISPR-associated protein Cas2